MRVSNLFSQRIETSKGTFFIRPYQEGDEVKIIALFKEVFGKEKSLKLWRWEFLENPYGTEIMLCFSEDGDLVAQCASIPVEAYLVGSVVRIAQVVDCMSSKRFRGIFVKKKGLYILTISQFFKTYTGPGKNVYLYGFPGERHYRLGVKMLGFKPSRSISFFVSTVETKGSLFSKMEKVDENVFIQGFEDFNRYMSKFIPFMVKKDAEYIRWRYLLHPEKEYIFLAFKNILGKPKALFVVSQDGYLLDFASTEETSLVKGLSMLEPGFKVWVPSGSPLENIFRKAGWKKGKEPFGAVASGISFCSIPTEWTNANFFYTTGDCDLF